MLNLQKVCQDLIKDLPSRQKEVILRRFALTASSPKDGFRGETLESIGKSFGVTRERVRQIEEDGLKIIKEKVGKYGKIFQDYGNYFKKFGGLKKETTLLKDLGGAKGEPYAYFLLTLGENFKRSSESPAFHSLWQADKDSLDSAKKVINSIYNQLKESGKPLLARDFKIGKSLNGATLFSYLEISKIIHKNKEGFYGLKNWPEINPRGIKDKAYLTLKKVGKPLHFADVAKAIEGALVQTVHNELIRDSRFVLVGRGMYALSEWGYYPGQVKDVISRVLKESSRPLTKDKILERVLEQRLVKENTIFLNLSNKNYFLRDSRGRYQVKEI